MEGGEAMFGLEYLLALMKIMIQIGFAIVTAIPFTITWNTIAPIYLDFLPLVYQDIPFWHVVSVILVCTYVGELITKVTPTFITITQTNK